MTIDEYTIQLMSHELEFHQAFGCMEDCFFCAQAEVEIDIEEIDIEEVEFEGDPED